MCFLFHCKDLASSATVFTRTAWCWHCNAWKRWGFATKSLLDQIGHADAPSASTTPFRGKTVRHANPLQWNRKHIMVASSCASLTRCLDECRRRAGGRCIAECPARRPTRLGPQEPADELRF